MQSSQSCETMAWSSRVVAPPGNVPVLREALARQREGVFLESTLVGPKAGRFSIFAFDPARVIISSPGMTGACVDEVGSHFPGTSGILGQGSKENPLSEGGRNPSVSEGKASSLDPFRQLEDVCRPWFRFAERPGLPFVGGWIGYLSYEAGRFVEPSARFHTSEVGGLPLSRWALFDTVLIHDALADAWHVAGVELPDRLGGEGRAPLAQRLTDLEHFISDAAAIEGSSAETGLWHRRPACDPTGETPAPQMPAPQTPVTHIPAPRTPAFPKEWNYSREEYLAKVERALEYIRAGDIFQVNITRRCRYQTSLSPQTIYERLRESNPSAFAAYLPTPTPRGAVLSSSPELFLRVRGDEVTTRPIKGTRPRGETESEDARLREALAHSEKDRAELNMIIDLERNDLGRVCRFGSIRVVHDGEIEPLATVFHRTATIMGHLREDADTIDLLRATYPGGSVTGAPKVRAMQIIHELEPDARGPYCGAIGWIGLDGDASLNLAIRTMTVSDGHADIRVGSGIIADSDPVDEHDELQAKAAGMIAALRSPQPTGKVDTLDDVQGNPQLAGSHRE